MAVDPRRHALVDTTANVAAYRTATGATYARVLKAGDLPRSHEWRTVAHQAVCPVVVAERETRRLAGEGVLLFPTAAQRRARTTNRKGRRHG